MLRDTGEMSLESMNDANVPVVCFLCKPDRENGMWTWTARNFMPRKEYCGSSWKLEADTKEEIMEALQEVKDALVEVLDQYEEEGAEEKADTLTEALDALEDAYDVINDVVMDEI